MTSPNTEPNILPEHITVKIGKNKFQIGIEYLISSMVQQVIHKNNSLYTSDDFMMVMDESLNGGPSVSNNAVMMVMMMKMLLNITITMMIRVWGLDGPC